MTGSITASIITPPGDVIGLAYRPQPGRHLILAIEEDDNGAITRVSTALDYASAVALIALLECYTRDTAPKGGA